MLKYILLLLTAVTLWASAPAATSAQNITCPTRPYGDNTNACASTAFVQQTASAPVGVTYFTNTTATLETLSVSKFVSGIVIQRLGYYTAGDGGGANYTASSTPCASPDGFSQLPSADNGCFLIAGSPGQSYDIRAAGAHCDGNSTTPISDSAATQVVVSAHFTAVLPSGYTCLWNSDVTLSDSYQQIFGYGSTIQTAGPLDYLFRTSIDHAGLFGLTINDPAGYVAAKSTTTTQVTTFVNNAYTNTIGSGGTTTVNGGSVYAGGSGYTVSSSGTATWAGSGCAINPVLNITTNASGAVSAVTSVATAGVCSTPPINNATTWTIAGLGTGTGAGFNITSPACIVQTTTGTGTAARLSGAISGGGLAIGQYQLGINVPGAFTVNPQWAATGNSIIISEPVTAVSGCGSLTGATATLEMSSGTGVAAPLWGINITNGGSGYTAATVSFSGGGGSGAAGTVNLTAAGAVGSITLTNPGSGYTSPPTVTITGNGTGATGTALVSEVITVSSAAATASSPAFQTGQRLELRTDDGHWTSAFITAISGNNLTLSQAAYDPAAPGATVWASFGSIDIAAGSNYCSVQDINSPSGSNLWAGVLLDGGYGTTGGTIFNGCHLANISISSARMFGLVIGEYVGAATLDSINLYGGWNPEDALVGTGSATTFTLSQRQRKYNSLFQPTSIGCTAPCVAVNGVGTAVSAVPIDGEHFTLASPPANGATINASYNASGAEGFTIDLPGAGGGITASTVQSLQWDKAFNFHLARGGWTINNFVGDASDIADVYVDGPGIQGGLGPGQLGFAQYQILGINGGSSIQVYANGGAPAPASGAGSPPSGIAGTELQNNPTSNINLCKLVGGYAYECRVSGMLTAMTGTNPGSPNSIGALCNGCSNSSFANYANVFDLAHGTSGSVNVDQTGTIVYMTGTTNNYIRADNSTTGIGGNITLQAVNGATSTANVAGSTAVNLQYQPNLGTNPTTELTVTSTYIQAFEKVIFPDGGYWDSTGINNTTINAASGSSFPYVNVTGSSAPATGIYRPSTNVLGLSAGASETVALTSGVAVIEPTTASTSTSTGALVDNGGLGVAGAVYVGGAANFTGIQASNAAINVSGTISSTGSNSAVSALSFVNAVIGTTTPSTTAVVDMFWEGAELGATATSVTALRGILVSPNITSAYTGTAPQVFGTVISDLANSGTNPVTAFYEYFAAGSANGNGAVSGTYTNRQYYAAASTSAAGTGGSITNVGADLGLGSGSSTGTTNIALRITGNGGAASTNYAIDSTSTAASSLAGTVAATGLIATAAAPTVSASQVGFGGTTAASSSCGSLASAVACLVINVAGTIHYIPYY